MDPVHLFFFICSIKLRIASLAEPQHKPRATQLRGQCVYLEVDQCVYLEVDEASVCTLPRPSCQPMLEVDPVYRTKDEELLSFPDN